MKIYNLYYLNLNTYLYDNNSKTSALYNAVNSLTICSISCNKKQMEGCVSNSVRTHRVNHRIKKDSTKSLKNLP